MTQHQRQLTHHNRYPSMNATNRVGAALCKSRARFMNFSFLFFPVFFRFQFHDCFLLLLRLCNGSVLILHIHVRIQPHSTPTIIIIVKFFPLQRTFLIHTTKRCSTSTPAAMDSQKHHSVCVSVCGSVAMLQSPVIASHFITE